MTDNNAIHSSDVRNFFKGMNILHRAVYRTKEAALGDSLRDRFDQFIMFIETQLLIIQKTSDIRFDVATMKSYLEGLKEVFTSNLLIQDSVKDQFDDILKMAGIPRNK